MFHDFEFETLKDKMCTPGDWAEFTPCDAECDSAGQMFRSRECQCPPEFGAFDTKMTKVIIQARKLSIKFEIHRMILTNKN